MLTSCSQVLRPSLDLTEDFQLQLEARKTRVNKDPHVATGTSLELQPSRTKDIRNFFLVPFLLGCHAERQWDGRSRIHRVMMDVALV